MDAQVYKLLAEAYEVLVANEGRSLTSVEQAKVGATLRSLLVLFGEETEKPAKAVDSVGEARRPPLRPQKQRWWSRLGL